ncbi:MAG: hypothetical protein M3137_01930 [Actinomycetota bacterium]|nr:hypothetical protein [Actinomycetota bacterium]
MTRAARLLAPLSAACGATSLLLVVLFVVRSGAAVGTNVFLTQGAPVEANVIDADNSPSVARNPRHDQEVVATWRVDRPQFSSALAWSGDGGATWHRRSLPLPPGNDRPFAPDVAFGPDGTLYVLYSNLEGTGNDPANLWLATSVDGGRTLDGPGRIAGQLAFQARIAVGAPGEVYVTWLQAAAVGALELPGSPNPVVAAHSTDGGRTFSDPVPVSDSGRPLVGAASPVVDTSGRLLVLYEDFKGDRRDFLNLEGPPWEQPFGMVLTRSDDGGRSFSAGTELESDVLASHRFLVFLPEFPSLASGPGHTVYVSWADSRNGDQDVFLRRSDDDGRTWAPAVRVNDNPEGDGTSQDLPRVAVAPGGRVDVLYLDRRRDRTHNRLAQATLASSTDGGRSFSSRRASSQLFDSQVGSSADPKFPVDFGSRLALLSGDGQSLAVWTDTRLGSNLTGRQDIVAAIVRRPSTSRALAIAIVLAGAGAVGALVSLRTRYSGPGSRRLIVGDP